jgi:hypothetical protein
MPKDKQETFSSLISFGEDEKNSEIFDAIKEMMNNKEFAMQVTGFIKKKE